jgi:NADH-quinone oxidoreductase subunit I
MFGIGLLKGLRITLKHFFGRRVTQGYPEEAAAAPRYRGGFTLEAEKCTACGLCKNACPNRVITVEGEKGEDGKRRAAYYRLDLEYCLFCGLCVEACPFGALTHTQEFEHAGYHRQQLFRELIGKKVN